MLLVLGLVLCANDFYYEYGKKVEVTKVKGQRSLGDASIEQYTTSSGKKVGIKNEIIVKCKQADCVSTLNKYNLTNITNLTDTVFLVKLVNDENIFEIVQKLYLDENIEFANPNFVKTRTKR